jgi:hypothetical protein
MDATAFAMSQWSPAHREHDRKAVLANRESYADDLLALSVSFGSGQFSQRVDVDWHAELFGGVQELSPNVLGQVFQLQQLGHTRAGDSL